MLFRLRTERFDTVLMDYQMPGLKAEPFIEALRMMYPEIKVLLITAAWRAESLSEELRTDAFISKSFDPTQLSKDIAAL